MAISKISFKQGDTVNNNEKAPVSHISSNNNLERIEKNDKVVIQSKNNSNWKKYSLGALITIALLAGGDFIFAKGKHVKKIFGIKQAEEASNNLKEGAENVFESVSKFTEEGNSFKDYKAWTSDNKLFTGKVKVQAENGGTNIFEYNEGALKSVECLDKDGNIIQNHKPIPPHVTDGVLTLNSVEMNRFRELQGIYGSEYGGWLHDIDNFAKRHKEYEFLPSGGHPVYRLNYWLHELVQNNPEVANLGLSEQLEILKTKMPAEYNSAIHWINCISPTIVRRDTHLCYRGTEFVDGMGIGKGIYSKYLVEPNPELAHTYDIRINGGLDVHHRKRAIAKLPDDPPPPSPAAAAALKNDPPSPPAAAVPLRANASAQVSLPNDVTKMINSMFKNGQQEIPKALEVAKAFLEKHPNAKKETIGVALKLEFGGLKPEVKEKAQKAFDDFVTKHPNATDKEIGEFLSKIFKEAK